MKNIDPDLDLVLYAFMEAAPDPTDADVFEWQKRFPQFAKDIRDHAEAAKRCNAAVAVSRTDRDIAEAEAYGASMAMGLGSVPNLVPTAERSRPVKTGSKEPEGPKPPRKPPGWTMDR